jgi:hypothetical protein
MSKPRYKWWGYARRVLYDWPRLNELHRDITAMSLAPPAYDVPRVTGHIAGRVTETAAIRELSPQEQREYDAVARAISMTGALPDSALRLELVSLVFWRRTHTLEGAALRVSVSSATAKRWQGAFIRDVARGLGLL